MTSFYLGQRVRVVVSENCAIQKGTVAGMGWHTRPRDLDSAPMVPHVLVALDTGFYGQSENGEKKFGFVSIIVVHPDSLRDKDIDE